MQSTHNHLAGKGDFGSTELPLKLKQPHILFGMEQILKYISFDRQWRDMQRNFHFGMQIKIAKPAILLTFTTGEHTEPHFYKSTI